MTQMTTCVNETDTDRLQYKSRDFIKQHFQNLRVCCFCPALIWIFMWFKALKKCECFISLTLNCDAQCVCWWPLSGSRWTDDCCCCWFSLQVQTKIDFYWRTHGGLWSSTGTITGSRVICQHLNCFLSLLFSSVALCWGCDPPLINTFDKCRLTKIREKRNIFNLCFISMVTIFDMNNGILTRKFS